MSGIDGLMAEPRDRWVKAAGRAQGLADNGLSVAVKTYYTRYFPAGLAILLAVGTAGGILAFGGGSADWASYLMFGVALAGLGVFVGGLVYNAKKVAPAAQVGRVAVVLSLQDEEQKRIRRQIIGTEPFDSDHREVSRGAAVQLRKSIATQLILAPALPLLFIPQAVGFFTRGDDLMAWLMAICVVALVIGIALLVRDFQRSGRFLERTAEQADP
ncbi:hypothetical protein [Arthrobacter sp. 35W]|uniref:hypothetical protein n=1 Tax=Arthrobacter sp. 35W TaxID=1132441 RepID=UPI0004792EAC|nr:hypothetical protein [Arthrobacter sp. 35W]